MDWTQQPRRSLIDLDVIRAHHSDALRTRIPAVVWVAIGDLPILVDEIERLRSVPVITHAWYVNLLAAARASVAAEREGERDPLSYLRDELDAFGQVPARDLLPPDLLGSSHPSNSWRRR